MCVTTVRSWTLDRTVWPSLCMNDIKDISRRVMYECQC